MLALPDNPYPAEERVVVDVGKTSLHRGVLHGDEHARRRRELHVELRDGVQRRSRRSGRDALRRQTTSPGQLGTLDTSAFTIQTVGQFSVDIGQAELTGTGSGQLYGFGVVSDMSGANFAAIDEGDATILGEILVPTPDNPNGWAFSFWGGDFYFFTSYDTDDFTTVGRYLVANGNFDASYAVLQGGHVVGAGASTCAPR